MFSDCKSLMELNRRRAELIKSGESLVIVNAEYNKMRVALLSVSSSIRPIEVHRAPTVGDIPYTAFPYGGPANDKTKIIITERGVLYE